MIVDSSISAPIDLISEDNLFTFLQDLTSIQAYSGWRNSATQGEREALDYVANQLFDWPFLIELGLEIEREDFRVYMTTELWESRLALNVNGKQIEVPASALRGERDYLERALRFDSDGELNDLERNPVTVDAPVIVIRSVDEIGPRAHDKIVLLDYALLDRTIIRVPTRLMRSPDDEEEVSAFDQAMLRLSQTTGVAEHLIAQNPAAIVLVTQFTNRVGASHGTFVGDANAFQFIQPASMPPVLIARIEDMAAAGIESWDDLSKIAAAQLVWDADILSPAPSSNLVVRIRGRDASRAVILGAHIDSPNNPGAMDNGTGAAALLEVARVLNEARMQPPIDLYLVWFGSEELGLYGSAHFVATHQELLDRTVAMLQVDKLARPMNNIQAHLELQSMPYSRFGDDRLPWPDYLAQVAQHYDLPVQTRPGTGFSTDNSVFTGFNVPNANLTYVNASAMGRVGGVQYASYTHSPYDTIELAREVSDVFRQMAQLALIAALHASDAGELRVTAAPHRRALFLANHTEVVHLSPAIFVDLSMALALEGFDVDMIPFGQPLTAADLEAVDLAIALPVIDYSIADELDTPAWSPSEIDALDQYVTRGGMLVLTGSAHRLKFNIRDFDPNEDWNDVNTLAQRFGVTYQALTLNDGMIFIESDHDLMDNVSELTLASGNGLLFQIDAAQVLAQSNNQPVIALKAHGAGQVLALADVGLLHINDGNPVNLRFWQNLARMLVSS